MPSYLEVQMIQFQQFTVFWRPLSIEKSTFAKSCVFNQFQDPPCFFEPKIKKNTTFREKITLSANAHANYDDRNTPKGENALLVVIQ